MIVGGDDADVHVVPVAGAELTGLRTWIFRVQHDANFWREFPA